MCGDLSHVHEAVPGVGQYSVGLGVYLMVSEMLHWNVCDVTSLFTFWRAPITSFSFCQITWVVYHVMFRMEMMCTQVSYCFVCSCISRFMHHFISVISLVVVVPVNHCIASPKKGLGSSWVMYYQQVIIFLRMGSV